MKLILTLALLVCLSACNTLIKKPATAKLPDTLTPSKGVLFMHVNHPDHLNSDVTINGKYYGSLDNGYAAIPLKRGLYLLESINKKWSTSSGSTVTRHTQEIPLNYELHIPGGAVYSTGTIHIVPGKTKKEFYKVPLKNKVSAIEYIQKINPKLAASLSPEDIASLDMGYIPQDSIKSLRKFEIASATKSKSLKGNYVSARIGAAAKLIENGSPVILKSSTLNSLHSFKNNLSGYFVSSIGGVYQDKSGTIELAKIPVNVDIKHGYELNSGVAVAATADGNLYISDTGSQWAKFDTKISMPNKNVETEFITVGSKVIFASVNKDNSQGISQRSGYQLEKGRDPAPINWQEDSTKDTKFLLHDGKMFTSSDQGLSWEPKS